MLDDELELIREEWSMPIHLDGLQVFPGKEWLETALDFPHGAFGLLQESPEIFHAGYGVSDVVPEGNLEPINRVQLYLCKQACREDESEEECILEYNLDRGRSEGTDGRPCILQEIDRRVVIVLIVH